MSNEQNREFYFILKDMVDTVMPGSYEFAR